MTLTTFWNRLKDDQKSWHHRPSSLHFALDDGHDEHHEDPDSTRSSTRTCCGGNTMVPR